MMDGEIRFGTRIKRTSNKYSFLPTAILRPKVGTRWITTNFMPFHADIDPGETADDFTISTWDTYPVSGLDKNVKDETFRLGDPATIRFTHDYIASYQNRWALME